MYNRPADPTAFLEQCLARLHGSPPERITWDLLLNSKKDQLPPIEGESDLPETPGLGEKSKPLPPIQQNFEAFIEGISVDPIHLECSIVFGICPPGSSKRKLFNKLQFPNWLTVSVSQLIYQFLNAAAIFQDDPRVLKLRELVTVGDNIPDVFVLYLISKYLKSVTTNQVVNGVVIEGYPRTLEQYKMWQEFVV